MLTKEEIARIKQFFGFFGLVEDRVVVEEKNDTIVVSINIPEEEAGRFIGRFASTLDSMQLILSMMINSGAAEHRHLVVDVAGYRERRLGTLKSMVERVQKDVVATGTPHALPPLSASERREIHLMFADDAKLTTFSQGEGADRRVFIAPRD